MIFIIYLLLSDGLGGRIFVELIVYISLQLYILFHLDSCILGSRAPHFTYITFVVIFGFVALYVLYRYDFYYISLLIRWSWWSNFVELMLYI